MEFARRVNDRLQVADLARALEDGPCSGSRLAHRLGTRKADVLRELRTNPLFEQVGDGRYTVWRLAGTGQEPMDVDASTDVVLGVARRLELLESRLDALERTNGASA
jgi:hypothetical protein